MKPEIKKRWIEALRSAQYTKARGRLCVIDNFNDVARVGQAQKAVCRFCALGVLCDLAAKDNVVSWVETTTYSMAIPEEINGFKTLQATALPLPVMLWAGLESEDPLIEDLEGYPASITELNDGKLLPFADIADCIERSNI